jgi:superfamily II DNA or RNA helicase
MNCNEPKFSFLFQRRDWILSSVETRSDFELNKALWADITQHSPILDRLTGDRLSNMEKIIATLNMFPEYISSEIAKTYKHRMTTLDASNHFCYLAQRGYFYKMTTLVIDVESDNLIILFPKKSSIALNLIRIFRSFPGKIETNLNYAMTECDIERYCVFLYESIYLSWYFRRNMNFSLVYFRIPQSITIVDERLCEIMSTRNSINCCHMVQEDISFLNSISEEMKSVVRSRTWDFYFVWKSIPNRNKFQGDIVLRPRHQELHKRHTFYHEALFYDLIHRLTGQELSLPDHCFRLIPQTTKLLQEKFTPDYCDSTDLHIPVFVQTQGLTEEQSSTIAFIRKCEKTNFRDQFSFKINCEDGKNVILCSPYLGNATIIMSQTNWDSCGQMSGGVIANQTGSGKTLCVLASCQTGCSLVIVPDHLSIHWATEINKHTSLKTQANEDSDYALIFGRAKNIPRRWLFTKKPLLIVISSSAFRSKRWFELPIPKEFNRVFVDEAHTLSSTRSMFKQLQDEVTTKYIWAITATPYKNWMNICRLIQFDQFLKLINSNKSNLLQKSIPIWQHFTISTKTKLEFVRIRSQVIYAYLTPDENKFFAELRKCIQNIHLVTSGSTIMVRRVFRILERVSAGGRVNGQLMLKVIQRCLMKKRSRTDSAICNPIFTTVPGFMKSTDQCTVCLEGFLQPLQLQCGHVYCKECLLSMIDLDMSKCAICRTKWEFPIKTYLPSWSQEPQTLEHVLNLKEYYQLLEGHDTNTENTIELKGKYLSFQEQLNLWISNRTTKHKLVIYVKRKKPAQIYLAELRKTNLSILTAGVEGMCKFDSVQNIEQFRKGKHDVLLVNIKYSNGFDLPIASNLWIMDYDLEMAKMEQCRGRCIRLGQQHLEIEILVFLYQNTFDDFLYHYQHVGCITYSLGNCILLAYYFFNEDPESIFHQVKLLGHRIFGDDSKLIMTAKNKNIRINHVVNFNLRSKIVNERYIMAQLFEKSYNDPLFIGWRKDFESTRIQPT